jgi:hypothetical protein
MWMLAGVLLSMLPTVADMGHSRGSRIVSKLTGTLALGMFCPLVGHRLFQDNEIVRDLAQVGWTWLAAGFIFGLSGWALVRAVLALVGKKVIQPIHKLAGDSSDPADPFRAETDIPPESYRVQRRRYPKPPIEDDTGTPTPRPPGDD